MWNRLAKIVSILSVVIFIPAFSGIVGNRADSIFLIIISFFQGNGTILVAKWLLMLVILLIILVILIGLGIASLYYRSQQVAISLVKLDDSLLRLLSSFKQNPDLEDAAKLLFQEFLTDTLELFTDGCRISILRPDGDSELLTIWQSLRVPPETIDRTRFYIGSNKDDTPFPPQDNRLTAIGCNCWLSEHKIYISDRALTVTVKEIYTL